jgi:hypothetical protein
MERKMLDDESLARLRAHRNNVHRYRRLLATQLTDLERGYIERRIQEEQSAMESISGENFRSRGPRFRFRNLPHELSV